jgi:hypothetical protein
MLRHVPCAVSSHSYFQVRRYSTSLPAISPRLLSSPFYLGCTEDGLKLYPYSFVPRCPVDKRYDGWKIFSLKYEFERMNLQGTGWKLSNMNKQYEVSQEREHVFVVIPFHLNGSCLLLASGLPIVPQVCHHPVRLR